MSEISIGNSYENYENNFIQNDSLSYSSNESDGNYFVDNIQGNNYSEEEISVQNIQNVKDNKKEDNQLVNNEEEMTNINPRNQDHTSTFNRQITKTKLLSNTENENERNISAAPFPEQKNLDSIESSQNILIYPAYSTLESNKNENRNKRKNLQKSNHCFNKCIYNLLNSEINKYKIRLKNNFCGNDIRSYSIKNRKLKRLIKKYYPSFRNKTLFQFFDYSLAHPKIIPLSKKVKKLLYLLKISLLLERDKDFLIKLLNKKL